MFENFRENGDLREILEIWKNCEYRVLIRLYRTERSYRSYESYPTFERRAFNRGGTVAECRGSAVIRVFKRFSINPKYSPPIIRGSTQTGNKDQTCHWLATLGQYQLHIFSRVIMASYPNDILTNREACTMPKNSERSWPVSRGEG